MNNLQKAAYRALNFLTSGHGIIDLVNNITQFSLEYNKR